MIDWARVTELREETGADDFAEIVEIFLEEVEEEIGKLHDQTGGEILVAAFHLLKGCALNLGFERFSDLCQSAETAAANARAATVDIAKIESAYQASKTEFLKGLSALDAA